MTTILPSHPPVSNVDTFGTEAVTNPEPNIGSYPSIRPGTACDVNPPKDGKGGKCQGDGPGQREVNITTPMRRRHVSGQVQ